MGAYFGYAVASGDIDGDGLDDLIVGAPMYTVPDNPEMTIETGRVYVIYQGVGPEKFRKVDSRYVSHTFNNDLKRESYTIRIIYGLKLKAKN